MDQRMGQQAINKDEKGKPECPSGRAVPI